MSVDRAFEHAFAAWRGGLDDLRAGRALAVISNFFDFFDFDGAPSVSSRSSPEATWSLRLTEAVMRILQDSRFRRVPPLGAEEAALRFEQQTQGARQLPRLVLSEDLLSDALLRLLSQPGVSRGTRVQQPARARRHAWDLPLRVEVLGAGERADAVRAMRDQLSFIEPAVGRSAHVLVLVEPLRASTAALLAGPQRQADLVLALAGAGGMPLSSLVDTVTECTDAGGVAVFANDAQPPAYLLERVMYELAHDLPLDEALRRASDADLYVWLSDALLEAAHPRQATHRIARRFQAAPQSTTLELPEEVQRRLPISRALVTSAREVGNKLRDLAERGTFHRESGDTLTAAYAHRALRALLPEAAAVREPISTEIEPPARFLQGRLHEGDAPPEAAPLEAQQHPRALGVRIGLPAANWVAAAAPAPLGALPPDGIDVDVVFSIPPTANTPSPRSQQRRLHIPARGSSTELRFPFDTPRSEPFRARVTVLAANRVLQTALFYTDEAGALQIKLTELDHFQHIPEGTPPDAALVLNEAGGEMVAYAHTRDGVQVARLTHVRDAIAGLTRILDPHTTPEWGYDGGIGEPELTKLLKDLAAHGRLLWDALPDSFHELAATAAAGAFAPRIQIVNASADEIVPLELAYTHEAPLATSALCPGWRAALASGRCAETCPSTPWTRREVVCPRAFLGQRALLERSTGPAASPRQTLRLDRGALLGMSARVHHTTGPVSDGARLQQALEQRAAPVVVVTDRPTWDTAAQTTGPYPTLLVLLPHVDKNAQQIPTMELGDPASVVSSAHLLTEHLCGSGGGSCRPLVLLVGCETADDPVAFHNLMARFVNLKAAAVLSTISKIRGPEAARAVTRLVELLLAQPKQPRTFGEVLLDVRRQLLAKGDPLALTFVTYGDIDIAVQA